jgi:hypothetical protein
MIGTVTLIRGMLVSHHAGLTHHSCKPYIPDCAVIQKVWSFKSCHPSGVLMKYAANLFLRLVVLSLFSLTVFSSFSATACAQAADKTIVSKTADVDGLKMHYLTIGHGGTNLILLHGYAENSHMWQPIIPCWRRSSQ